MDKDNKTYDDYAPGESQDNDVEQEDVTGDASQSTITEPFNPNDIDVDISTVNLGYLIEQLENDEIELKPDYQRASDVWDETKKSRLIESILLGLPLPSFYFSEDVVSQKLSIVDGLQRICAIRDFVLEKKNPLKLQNLQFLLSFNGKTFADLARPEIKRIRSLKITMNTLRKDTPGDVKYVIFQRVNTAGVPLTPQEMRHALNQGPAAVFIKELAETDSFRQATNFSVRTKRMQDRDFANRFVAFYLLGYESYNGELDIFLNEGMARLNRITAEQREEIREAFDKSMRCCYRIFGEHTFRKRKRMRERRRPLSRSVYDTLSVNVARLSDEQRSVLERRRRTFGEKMIELFNNDKFHNAISVGTGQKYNVDMRFRMVAELIDEILSL